MAHLVAAAPKKIVTARQRQDWIDRGVNGLRHLFRTKQYHLPKNVRATVGWPRGNHGKGRAIGQCWSLEVSSDNHAEIFVSPEIGTPKMSARILDILAHECVHATVGTAAGHKAPFKRCAEAIGLTGPMTATVGGPQFRAWAGQHIEKHGPYPAGAIRLDLRSRQSTRLIKCECEDCGYVARVTRKWIASAGTPICPDDNIRMICEAGDD